MGCTKCTQNTKDTTVHFIKAFTLFSCLFLVTATNITNFQGLVVCVFGLFIFVAI